MSSNRRAFTLIEMLIAIALGLVLVYTAAAGLRVAAQTVTVANRLALENEIMRNGFEIALDEVDLWRAYDEPVDAMRQGQRSAGGIFCPFKSSAVGVSTTAPATSATIIIDIANIPGPTDSERGWNSDYVWPVADPRTWFRNNMAERSGTALHFGGYKRFSTVGPADATGRTHTWLANQLDRLVSAFGYYGMADYLPAGTIYDYAGGSFPVTGGGMCSLLANTGGLNFQNGDGGADFAQSLYRATKNTAFAVYPLTAATPINATSAAYTRWNVGQNANQDSTRTFQLVTSSHDPVLEIRPTTWPTMTVSTARTLAYNRFACVARVHWTSPLTGNTSELSFTCFGTSLRGARQQRRADSGWAVWHSADAGTGSPNPNDATLDNAN
ncbi:MAG: prepilin-type N-terminal cleavage/methylation domain-containing protein [Planctomycetes bacterium]|nr:prepilin-type N-terminal cleavage/methylation domain-containing protein [Planctomycetota bacterium]